MADDEKVYVTAMVDTLEKKKNIVLDLLEATCAQEELLHDSGADSQTIAESFEAKMDEKDALLKDMEEADRGFDTLFHKMSDILEAKKYQYKPQIVRMQELIREITDIGVRIEKKEQSNRTAFQAYITAERRKIGANRASNRSAVSYYQNMPNQHREWQSYFLDKKN